MSLEERRERDRVRYSYIVKWDVEDEDGKTFVSASERSRMSLALDEKSTYGQRGGSS